MNKKQIAVVFDHAHSALCLDLDAYLAGSGEQSVEHRAGGVGDGE